MMAMKSIYLVCGQMGDHRYETFEQWNVVAFDEEPRAITFADTLQWSARLYRQRADLWRDRRRERYPDDDVRSWVGDTDQRKWRSRNPFRADPKFDPFNNDAGGVSYWVEPIMLEVR